MDGQEHISHRLASRPTCSDAHASTAFPRATPRCGLPRRLGVPRRRQVPSRTAMYRGASIMLCQHAPVLQRSRAVASSRRLSAAIQSLARATSCPADASYEQRKLRLRKRLCNYGGRECGAHAECGVLHLPAPGPQEVQHPPMTTSLPSTCSRTQHDAHRGRQGLQLDHAGVTSASSTCRACTPSKRRWTASRTSSATIASKWHEGPGCADMSGRRLPHKRLSGPRTGRSWPLCARGYRAANGPRQWPPPAWCTQGTRRSGS